MSDEERTITAQLESASEDDDEILLPKLKSSKKMKRLMRDAKRAEKRGVCYLSRIPPHMDPLKLRQTLSQFGEIQRIYLTPTGLFSISIDFGGNLQTITFILVKKLYCIIN